MTKSLKGTKTLGNLMKAFAGESQARNRYSMYASVAGKEGYKQIEALFLETGDNERIHGKNFYKEMVAGMGADEAVIVNVDADYPVQLGTTLQNLKAAAAGENEEYTELYPTFGDVAEEEGFPVIAALFRNIAKVEWAHEQRYLKLAANIEAGKVFKKDQPTRRKCTKCGYIHEGPEAPKVCPACAHPQAYFEVMAENY